MAKWYYQLKNGDEKLVTSAELRQLAQSGLIGLSDKIRREDSTDWHEAKHVKGLFVSDQQINGNGDQATAGASHRDSSDMPKDFVRESCPGLNPDDYRMPHEKKAYWIGMIAFAVLGIFVLPIFVAFPVAPIILFPILVIGVAASIWIQQSSYIGSSVAVSENQFPEVFHVATKAAQRLRMKQPEIFIKHSPEINASAIGFLGRKSVVLHSPLVEAMDEEELLFIIGHEFSHIKCGHTNLGVLTGSAGEISLLGFERIIAAVFRFHSPQAEYTCDRGGLIACRSTAAAAAALCKLAIGPELYKRMDVNKFLEQEMDLDQNDIAKLSESLSTHPYTLNRVRALTKFHESDAYRRLSSIAA